MLRLVVLLGLAALCVADNEHCCSAEDRHIVQEQWDVLWHDVESTKIKIGFGKLLLKRWATDLPEVKTLLSKFDIEHPDGPIFATHGLHVTNGFDLIINLLDDPDTLHAQLDYAAEKFHTRLPGLKKAHIKHLGKILHDNLPKVLDNYNSLSWKACFKGVFTELTAKLDH